MKHLFLGSNTPKGFVGFYDTVLAKGNRLFILKGGSGVGKHTFMKKCGKLFEEKGYEIEYLHCSNDVHSLDGIIIVELQVAMIDGTNPHMVDPKLPGCFDEIIDLGVFINGSEMERNKEAVFSLIQQKKNLYSSAYHMLSCASILYQDNSELLLRCTNWDRANQLLKELPTIFVRDQSHIIGNTRNIFSSSYTSNGYCNYIDTLLAGKKTFGIKSTYLFNRRLLQKIYKYGISCGYHITVCKSPLDPDEIDHLIFDEFAILSIDQYNSYDKVDVLHEIDDILIKTQMEECQQQLQWNHENIDLFLNRAIKYMENCSMFHNQLEGLYIPNMDFEGVDILFESTMQKISSYEKS